MVSLKKIIYYWQGNVNVVRRELRWKGILKYHLLNCKCHYFFYECMGLKKTTLSLLKGVTFSLVCVWVKSNWLNVTKYEVFIFWRRPLGFKVVRDKECFQVNYINWTVINLCYYGLTMNSVNLNGNTFINTILGVMIEASVVTNYSNYLTFKIVRTK